ncbi:hypothetical protein FB45DRAFT_260025 [Roridomyces roridus]|uniref:Protein kinase domain-containing protein n=1 Tax=Roridomyces roridus TaxID=1738132 RepID=A0AAD7FBD7_9AGAR|nr:hypothetical protein FB45DRAFT_260025 [Roridomyces roridus]
MAFISNASGFTLGEGTFNNIHGDFVIYDYQGVKRRRREDIEACPKTEAKGGSRWVEGAWRLWTRVSEQCSKSTQIIRNKHLKLTLEIGRGQGYLLHSGKIKGQAVIVKVFAGRNAREDWEATMTLSRRLLHPNLLRVEGASAPTSIHHFIAYEDAHRKTAEGPLAFALRDDLEASIVLGFKMISGLSSGIDYLSTQGTTLPLRPESFDVFLDINDRFLLSINPPADANPAHQEEEDTRSIWTLFNGLCQKVLRSANRVLHDEDIERTPTAFESSPRPPALWQSSPVLSSNQAIAQHDGPLSSDPQEAPIVPPRREYVWRKMDMPQSLANIAAQITRDLDLRRASINRLVWSDIGTVHRCPGYVREEVTLATRTADSAVVSHDAPTIQEVCSVCREVVNLGDVFRCVCGHEGMYDRAAV